MKGILIDGSWVEEPQKVKEEVRLFFLKRFQESDFHRPTLDGIPFQAVSQQQKDMAGRKIGGEGFRESERLQVL